MNEDAAYVSITSDVEKTNGVPIVVSQFGFKKIELNGKIYLQAMTEEEAVDMLKRIGGPQINTPWCFTGNAGMCYPRDFCYMCETHYEAGWVCVCARAK